MICRNCLAEIKPSGDGWMHETGLVGCRPFAAKAEPMKVIRYGLMEATTVTYLLNTSVSCFDRQPWARMKDIRNLGFERGFNCASWINLPEIGTKVWTDSDGHILVDESNQWYVVQTLAYESEGNERQFSPFEFTAHELNETEKPYDAWEVFEEGISAGIHANLQERMKG